MEPIGDALQLLKRQAAIQHSLRRDSATRVLEERELYLIRQRLSRYPAALHRLPEPVLLAAEGLWMQTLDEARKRAAAEQGSRKTSLAKDRQDLEVRSHVLSIRESELTSRLAASDRRIAQLETELATLTTMLHKEQASRLAAERRLNELPLGVAPRRGRATQPTATAARRKRIEKLRIPTTKTPRTRVTSARKVPMRRKPKS